MEPRHWLRIEGLTVLTISLAVYWSLGGPLWLLAVLALAPDLLMLGYLAGPRIGSQVYNVGHTYAWPLVLGAVGLWSASDLAVQVALIWTAHIGADRFFGYGLKYSTDFKETHLSTQPRPIDILSTED